MNRTARLFSSFVALSLLITACGDDTKKRPVDPAAATIVAFTVEPGSVMPGDSVLVSWETKNASEITLTRNDLPVDLEGAAVAEGTVSVTITEASTFVLEAKGKGEGVATETRKVELISTSSPAILSFVASPSTVAAGGTTTLSWETRNADTIRIVVGGGDEVELGDVNPAEGSVDVVVDATSTFKLIAEREGEEPAERELTVAVEGPEVRIVSFSADPMEVDEGGKVTLSWVTEHADTIQLFDGVTELQLGAAAQPVGSFEVSPAGSTTYRLVASAGEAQVERDVKVKVKGFPTANLSAQPAVITFGGEAILSWETTDAESVNIVDTLGAPVEGGPFELNGSVAVHPAFTETYTLVATGAGGKVTTDSAQVEVTPVILSFEASDPGPAGVGDVKEIRWTTGGALEVMVSNFDGANQSFTGASALEGSASLPMGAGGRFQIVATSGAQTATEEFTITVVESPNIGSFSANEGVVSLVDGSAILTLSWSAVTRATALELVADTLGQIPLGSRSLIADSIDVEIDADTTFTLTASNASGDALSTVVVRAVPLPVVSSFSASLDYVGAGETVELSWTTVDATNVTIEENGTLIPGPLPASGTLEVEVLIATTFEIKAYNDALDFDSDSISVQVGAPEILSFDASSVHVWSGSAVTFEWTSRGASEIDLTVRDLAGGQPSSVYSSITRGGVEAGEFISAPLTDVGLFEYRLEITNSLGTAISEMIQVRVGDGPTIDTFSLSPAAGVAAGSELTITWAAGVDPDGVVPTLALVADPPGTYNLPANAAAGSASFTMADPGSYTFTLTATTSSPGSTPATREATTTVFGVPAVTLVADPMVFDEDIHAWVSLDWTSENADTSLQLFELDGANPPILLEDIAAGSRPSGTHVVVPTAATTYRIVATNGISMTAQEEVTVTLQGTEILTFTATPPAYPNPPAPPAIGVVAGDEVNLEWTTKRATDVALDFLSGMSFSETFEPYIDVYGSGGTRVQLTVEWCCGYGDEGEGDLVFPAGFTFPFGGVQQTGVKVYANGLLSFDSVSGAGSGFQNTAFPEPNRSFAHIAPFWDDLEFLNNGASATGDIYWLSGSDADGDYLAIEWRDNAFAGTAAHLTFEVILRSSGNFEFRYGTMEGASGPTARADGSLATIGYQLPDRSQFHTFSHATAVPGGLSNRSFAYTQDASLDVNGSYAWSPLGGAGVTTRSATLLASGNGTDSSTLSVQVHPRAGLTVTPPAADPLRNVPFTLAWTTQNATGLTIVDPDGAEVYTAPANRVASGSAQLTALATGAVVYQVVATGALGHEVVRDVPLTVISADFGIASFTVSADEVDFGDPLTLSWETGDADVFEITANGEPLVLPGTIDFDDDAFTIPSMGGTTTFVLTITNLGTQATRTAARTVRVRTFTFDLVADLYDVPPGTPVTLSWATTSLSGEPISVTVPNYPMEEDLSGTNAFIEIAGLPDVVPISLSTDDTGSSTHTFASGFSFPFQGQVYTSAIVKADGFISFASSSSTTGDNYALPRTGSSDVHLAPFWDDLHRRSGTILAGPVGDDYVISWNHYSQYYGSASNPYDLNFQVVLHPGGTFEYRYGTMSPPTPSPATTSCYPDTCENEANGSSATIGYSMHSGTVGHTVHFGGTSNGASNTPFPGGLQDRTFRYAAPASSDIVITPNATGTYEVCATSGGFRECKSVEIVAEFEILSFDASAPVIDRNQTIDFSWATKNADTLTLRTGSTVIATEADVDPDSGVFSFTPTETATYTLEVGNTHLNQTRTATRTVTVKQFGLDLQASGGSGIAGDPITLTWTADSFSGEPFVLTTPMEEVSGSSFYEDISLNPGHVAVIGAGSTGSPSSDSAVINHSFADGFTFDYLGQQYTSVRIAMDGYLSFDTSTTTSATNEALPSTSAAGKRVQIAPFWDNLYARGNGAVLVLSSPTEYVIQWSHVSMSTGSSTSMSHDLNFQVVLLADGSFQFRYGLMEGLSAPDVSSSCFPNTCEDEANGSAATIGYQNLAGTAGQQLHFGGASPSATNFPYADGLSGRAFEFVPYSSDGSVTITGYDTRDYSICAISGTSVECTRPLRVVADWRIVSFTPSEPAVPASQPVTLGWQAIGGEAVTLLSTVGGVTTELGMGSLDPDSDSYEDLLSDDTTYTLELHSFGRVKRATVLVRARTVGVSVVGSTTSALPGETVTLTWDTTSFAGGDPSVSSNFAGGLQEIPATFEDISGSPDAIIIGSGITNDSAFGMVDFDTANTGFSFPHFGTDYDSLLVSIKGIILGGTTSIQSLPWQNQTLPTSSTNDHNKVILAPYWGDLLTANSGAGVFSKFVSNPSGLDYFIIQFHKMSIWNNSGTSVTFQAVLFSDGTFEFRYADMLPLTNSLAQGHGRTIGYQASGGGDGGMLHYGGVYTATAPNPGNVFPGGMSNRAFRYEAPMSLSGSMVVTPSKTTRYEICGVEGGYSECSSFLVVVPEAGNAIITEVMIEPTGGPTDQWFEVRNLSGATLDLEGWEIVSGTASHLITGPLEIAPGAYATLAASAAPGFVPDYVYGGGVPLGSASNGEVLLFAGNRLISEIRWDSTWSMAPAVSIEADPMRLVPGVFSFTSSDMYCLSTETYDGGANAGTPGQPSPGCSVSEYVPDFLSLRPAIDISQVGHAISGLTAYSTMGSANLSFSFPFYGQSHSTISISSNGFITMTDSLSSSYITNVSLPSTAAPASFGLIAPFWDEFSYSRYTATFRMAEVEVGGQTVAVLQWNRVGPWDLSTAEATFQAQLWENGDIVFVYGTLGADGTYSRGTSGTVGIQAPGTSGTPESIQYSYNAPLLKEGMTIEFKKR